MLCKSTSYEADCNGIVQEADLQTMKCAGHETTTLEIASVYLTSAVNMLKVVASRTCIRAYGRV